MAERRATAPDHRRGLTRDLRHRRQGITGAHSSVLLGPLTVFGGIGTLRMSGLANDTSLDADLTGYRVLAGLKGNVFSLPSDQIDVYP